MSNTVEEFMASVGDEELLVRARAAITRMCSGDRRWVMTIPPGRRDSDFVLGEVCRRLEAAKAREEAEVRRRLRDIFEPAGRIVLEYGVVGDWDGAYDWEDDFSAPATHVAIPLPKDGEPCFCCGQVDHGQTGEYPCKVCGLPWIWDADAPEPPGEEPG